MNNRYYGKNLKKKSRLSRRERVKEKIKKKINKNHISYKVGLKRDYLFKQALLSLKKEGKIRDFIQTSRLSDADLNGIDFYVVSVDEKKYETFNFSITGKRWVATEKERHPNIIVMFVDIYENIFLLKQRILKEIKK
ncbi:hypothetical protein JW698_00330 [Candidatus Wolfebacteria bacterium]|nr:hypothetical protein [Candidatus Wolfebacteria bacterium]